MKSASRVSLAVEALDEICDRLAGGEGLRQICADAHLPHHSTVYRSMAQDGEVATRIVRAREAQQNAIADECVELADAATPGDWQVIRLRIWARQWRAAKLAPKTYGDKPGDDHPARETRLSRLLRETM